MAFKKLRVKKLAFEVVATQFLSTVKPMHDLSATPYKVDARGSRVFFATALRQLGFNKLVLK